MMLIVSHLGDKLNIRDVDSMGKMIPVDCSFVGRGSFDLTVRK